MALRLRSVNALSPQCQQANDTHVWYFVGVSRTSRERYGRGSRTFMRFFVEDRHARLIMSVHERKRTFIFTGVHESKERS